MTAAPSAYLLSLQEQYQKNPERRLLVSLCEQLISEQQSDRAYALAEEGVGRFPGYIAGQIVLAQACHATGRVDKAITIVRLILEAVPEKQELWELLEQLYRNRGEEEVADRVRIEARQYLPVVGQQTKKPDEHQAVLGAPTLLPVLELTEADIVADSSVSTDDDEADDEPIPFYTNTLAALYESQGFYDKARLIYQELLRTDPDNQEIKKKLARLSSQQEPLEPRIPTTGQTEPTPAPLDSDTQEIVTVLNRWLETIKRGM